jgi:hypothetical protein
MTDPRRSIPEPSYQWPGGPSPDDDPTPIESALAALKFGAILAAAVTIVLIYVATYADVVSVGAGASLAVLAAFLAPSIVAYIRTYRVRRRRPPGDPPP